MLVPAGAESFSEALRIGAETYHHLKGLLGERGLSTAVGDEGGFAPDFGSAYEACEAILEAAERAGHARQGRARARPGDERAASRRRLPARAPGRHARHGGHDRPLGRPVRPLPDRVDRGRARRDRLGGLAELTDRLGARLQLVGDDLFVTNVDFLRRGIDGARRQRDPRQGEPDRHADRDARRDRARAAQRLRGVISHRSGETEDATIADLAVATNAGQIKTGAPARSDRVAKYNQLLRIEEQLGDEAEYPGWGAFPRAARLSRARRRVYSDRRDRAHTRRTKIVATIGPASSSPEMVAALIEAGMDGARLNMSHGTHDDHARTRGARPRGRGGRGRPDRADRRPPGAEAPGRRPRRARSGSSDGESVVIAGEDVAHDGDLPGQPGRARLGAPARATTC